MKNPIYVMVVSMIVGTIAAHFGAPGVTQDQAVSPPEAPPAIVYEAPSSGGLIETRLQDGVPVTRTIRGRNPVGALAKGLKDATADEKEELEGKIREELEKQYDEFLAKNESQIDKLQERINKLKDQLDRRRRAKSKLVDLEFERIVNESEGLIWPERGRSGWSYSREGVYYHDDPFADGPSDPFADSPNFRSTNIRRPKRQAVPASPRRTR